MSHRKSFLVACLILSVLCMAAGYGIAANWIGAALAILLGPAWWHARRHARSWLPFVCLLGSVGLAVVGILTGSPALWMILGSTLSLAVWDLVLLDADLLHPSSVEQTHRYEKEHLQSLALALGGGLFAALLGRFLRIQVPFMVLLLSMTFILVALDWVWSTIKKSGKA